MAMFRSCTAAVAGHKVFFTLGRGVFEQLHARRDLKPRVGARDGRMRDSNATGTRMVCAMPILRVENRDLNAIDRSA